MRIDGRSPRDLRPFKITTGFLKHPAGSCLVEAGDTKVICCASIEDKVPPFVKGTSSGWLTAEYSMLPGATEQRTPREVSRGKPGGRTVEIQRLIGRSLRAAVALAAIGERTIWVACDVIQADGGTRTASITGGFVAVALALDTLAKTEGWQVIPIADYVAAVSVGVVQGQSVLDLRYSEDSTAEVDMNVVMTGRGEFIEVQGTGEHAPFGKERLTELLSRA
jgi:ribonuclease PH